MIVSRLILKNWRNFRHVDVTLQPRMFIVGPNAVGKSNLLDIFRFLRDIANTEGGGLQKAVRDRGGLPKLRCLSARNEPQVEIEVHLASTPTAPPTWRYAIGLRQTSRGHRELFLQHERVWKGEQQILNRPDNHDKKDRARLSQTHLEQITANSEFRDIAVFFQSITYLHLIPQVLRFPGVWGTRQMEQDPFGQGFLERIARTPEKTRNARLAKIQEGLQVAVPKLQQLRFVREEATGQPHLEAMYQHWRPNAGWQREDQFSDGTLRLIALLWSLLEGKSTLLLEEPELSLNTAIVRRLAPIIWRMQRQRKSTHRQIMISTHSLDLLADPGIDGHETLLLSPQPEGNRVAIAADIQAIREALEAGLSVGEVVPSETAPQDIAQLDLF